MQMSSAEQDASSGLIARGWMRLKAMLKGLKENVFSVFRTAKKLGQDDPRRVIHSLKVGLALTLVSLFYYYQPLYDSFGLSAMWAVMTVVVVFEFSVGKFVLILTICMYVCVRVLGVYMVFVTHYIRSNSWKRIEQRIGNTRSRCSRGWSSLLG